MSKGVRERQVRVVVLFRAHPLPSDVMHKLAKAKAGKSTQKEISI